MKISKRPGNIELSKYLRAVAAALEVKEKNTFRIRAYKNAATAIKHLPESVVEVWQRGELESISGVGSSIAQHLAQLFKTGNSKHFEKIFSGLPEAMFKMLPVSGIGAKTAYELCQRLGIRKAHGALKRLKNAAQDGEIQQLEGFGEKSEKEILENLKDYQKRDTNRMLLNQALKTSEAVVEFLKKDEDINKAKVLGSVRRRQATVGDIDIAINTKNPEKSIERFLGYKKIQQVLSKGEKKISVVLFNDIQVDLRIHPQESWGSLLQHFTGSKSHNIALRKLAQDKELSLSEYGIKKSDGELKKFSSEKSFYQHLGLEYIPPVLRENQGEIEAAQKNDLPNLIKQKDIKGDLHIHSRFDTQTNLDLGETRIEEILESAERHGYKYVAFSDHSPAHKKHSEKKIISLLKKRKNYIENKVYSREKRAPFVFISLEIDILKDGRISIPQKAFEYLDFAIVSVHSSFRLSQSKMTRRILRALKAHPKIKILGHPTGRLINRRSGYDADWKKIFSWCAKNNKYLEVNAHPSRLDLPDLLVKKAVSQGAKVVINTDSHKLDSISNMRYGVFNTQRGWAQTKDVVNSFNLKDFKKALDL